MNGHSEPTRNDSPRTNFGGNIKYSPRAYYTPSNEKEVLEILSRHSGEKILAVGRLHSWSPVVQVDGVMIDMRRFDSVVIHEDDRSPCVDVGAGCQIGRLLNELQKSGFTLLSQGLITAQAVAGAAGTGTHGSGKHSLSHYLESIRIAHYDSESGDPRIDEICEGARLLAARCSLGCLGVVTQGRIPIRRSYFVEEHFRKYTTLDEVLSQEEAYDLQQFYLVPWRWDFYAQHRREVLKGRSWSTPVYRAFWSVGMDVLLHFIVITLTRSLPAFCTMAFYRRVLPCLVPQGWKVVDRSDVQLSMRHDLFRHIETEIFVTRAHLMSALGFLTDVCRHAAGQRVTLSDAVQQKLAEFGLIPLWEAIEGRYVQHYPICVRRILPDDTLISMASGAEPRYSISIISYAPPSKRDGFERATQFLVKAMARLFCARPHWGKHCPIDKEDIEQLYPHLDEFRNVAAQQDPESRFANTWITDLVLSEAQ